MVKVAVTGATGFIGRNLVKVLSGRADVEVVAVVRGDVRNASSFGQADTVKLDVLSPPEDVFDHLGQPNVLIHLAWGGLPNYNSSHHIDLELPAHYRFLESVVRGGLKTLMVAGTCFEYGMQAGALSEEMEVNPHNSYGMAKDTLRKQLQALQKDMPFLLVWPRLFYLYGAGQAENSLYPSLRRAVASGEEVFPMSGGKQVRDFLPVERMAGYLASLALLGEDVGVVNVCSGKPVTVKEIVEMWIADNDWNIELNLGQYPYPDYEPMEFWGDATKLNRVMEKSGAEE